MLQQTHSVTFWHCQKMQKFYVLKHKHNHAIRVRSLKAPQGVLRVIPWKTWSWSGGDFQRKSIEVTSEEFESVTKHRDLNKSKKVLRIPPVKSKLIFIEHQDIERGLLNHTPTWHTGPPSVRWLRSYIWPSRMEGGRAVEQEIFILCTHTSCMAGGRWLGGGLYFLVCSLNCPANW